jgi:DNA polymerase III subunit delta'
VVLLLLSDRPSQILPTIASRCQPVRFDPLGEAAIAAKLESRGVAPPASVACARLALGDGERALRLALGDGPALRDHGERFARAALHGRAGQDRAWVSALAAANQRGRAVEEQIESELAEELETLAKSEKRKRQTEYSDRAKRASRRARTETLDLVLQLSGLYFRDLACVAAGAPELVHHADRADQLATEAGGCDPVALREAVDLVEETRARLALNVTEELACEALAYRLERRLSGGPPTPRARPAA